jgi:hypothetical protein
MKSPKPAYAVIRINAIINAYASGFPVQLLQEEIHTRKDQIIATDRKMQNTYAIVLPNGRGEL